MIVFLYFCFLPITVTQAQKDNGSNMNKESPPVTITLTSISVTDKIVELNYKIRNTSEQDIWICEGVNGGYGNFEVAMTKDSKTLLIRRRLSVPMFGFLEQPFGCYIRIRKGQSRKESLLLSLPIHPRRVFLEGRQLSNDIEYAKYLVLEIGFYSGDMPRMIFDMLEEAEKDPQKKHVKDTGYPIDIIGWLDGPLYFNEINEEVRDRDEQVIIPWTDQALKSEKILRATATDLNIPYVEYPLDRGYTFPILSSCTKIEIEYRPSMLDYFFSNSEQQLMNKTEMNYLQSQKTVVSDDLKLIGAMCDEIDHAHRIGQIVNESRSAHISCYNRDEFLTSFFVYGKESILTKDKQCLWHRGSLQSLKMFAAQIRPFELRIECASHIKNLWYRLRLYHIAQKTQLQDLSSESEIIYPVWTEWCDAMVHAYMDVGHYNENFLKAFICPSANEGKSNYAINPSCKPDSPADMVLLFETKASWDRYGGPDLFTFDNHDPKGGCVLLNDGIVKFIRTKEELQQLRWK
jgi:hypothetical protein